MFVAITAVPVTIQTLQGATTTWGVWFGLCWGAWGILWLLFFVLLVMQKPIAKFVGAVTVVVIAVDLGSNRRRREEKVAPETPSYRQRLGAIDIMQERISEQQLASEPPDVLLIPRLQPLGPFEYHRAALAIAKGREAVALMLPAIHASLSG